MNPPQQHYDEGQILMIFIGEDLGVQPATVTADPGGVRLEVQLKDGTLAMARRDAIRDVRPPQEALDAAMDIHLRMVAGHVRLALREAEDAVKTLRILAEFRERWFAHPYTADTAPIRREARLAGERLTQIGREI